MKMFVRDLMSRPAVTVRNGTTVDDAIKVLLREAAPEIYVIDDAGHFMGGVPDYELLKAQLTCTTGQTIIEDVTSRHTRPAEPQAPAEELAARFREGHHSRISVVENGRLIGQIDQRDVMRLLLALDRLKVDAEQDAGQGPLEPTAMRGPQFVRRHSSPREHVQDT